MSPDSLAIRPAYMLGRVTLNPLKHIDPIGTIAIPGFLIAMSVLTKAPLFIFGWAKPVPVQFANLRNPKRDMFWVAIGWADGQSRNGHRVGIPSEGLRRPTKRQAMPASR